MLKALASVAGSALTGGLNYASAKQNRRFQQQMSNTAYQRAAADLEKAGLNRILAIGSPASTPGGAVAQFPDFGNSINQGMATAQQIAQSEATTTEIVERTKGITAENQRKIVESQFWQAIGPLVQKAAGSAEKFLNYVSDPKNFPVIWEAMSRTSQSILNEARKVIEQNLPNLDSQIIQFITTDPTRGPNAYGQKINEQARKWLGDKIQSLGSGGPQ